MARGGAKRSPVAAAQSAKSLARPAALAAVATKEPDWKRLPTDTPPRIRNLLERCLAKEQAQRLHHVADARLEIEES